MAPWIVLGALLALWVLAHLKTSRPEGRYVARIHPYRRAMNYIMPTRTESVVYFEEWVDAQPLLDYLAEAKPAFGADVTHALVAALAVALAENPRLNRFVSGRRIYQRDRITLTFSMKRRKLDKRAALATVKLHVEPGWTFADLCAAIEARVAVERSGETTQADRELRFFARLPRPVMRFAVWLVETLDYYNLLPGFFIESEPMYASVFVANLGSLGMGAGYHHLFEFGTTPIFATAGQAEDRAVVVDGEIVIRRQIPLRFTYDERIDDGLTARDGIRSALHALRAPAEVFGCLAADGSDRRPLDAGA